MDKIIILDFGGQYAHLIANRIRRLGVYSEIKHNDVDIKELKSAKGIILSGGPQNISENDSLKCDPKIFDLKIPVLGICYGHQLTSHILGGEVSRGKTKEYGKATLEIRNNTELFEGLKAKETVWMSHGDYVSKLANGFSITASTSDCKTAAVANHEKKIYGIQFHPEVTHTENGMKMLENFVFKICKCLKNWDMKTFIREETSQIRRQIGDKKVFLLVSGGVDSTVCFALLNKALGEKNVYGLHIDNGFVRKNESKKVEEALKKEGFNNFHVVDASKEFFNALVDVYEPEHKRNIIGKVFLDVQDAETKKLNLSPDEWILGQGTIYPDTIESAGTKNASLIKTHHNRVEAIQKLIEQGKIIEPIKDLYKDEVRMVGEMLGLPHHLVNRHPFPGPGLAVRCLCIEKENKVDKTTENNIKKIAQKYMLESHVLPIKSVGVQGDSRTYAHPVALSGDTTFDELEKISTKITNEVPDVNRVVYLLTKTDLSNAKIKKSYLTKDRIKLLQEADNVIDEYLVKKNLYDKIWQFPVVLVPLSFNGGESIVLRPINSTEAMTANFTKLDMKQVDEMAALLMKIKGIDAVFYDVTNKPPATIEWE